MHKIKKKKKLHAVFEIKAFNNSTLLIIRPFLFPDVSIIFTNLERVKKKVINCKCSLLQLIIDGRSE